MKKMKARVIEKFSRKLKIKKHKPGICIVMHEYFLNRE